MSSDLNYTIVLNEQGPMGPAGPSGDPGPMGVGINSIIKTSTVGLVDTYTITYTNGIHQTFTVTNGDGIENIELLEPTIGQDPLVDIYQITTTGGMTYTFSVTNGSSISSIAKTGTSGLVDTYTITLTNGDTETFTVTNGQAGEITAVTASVDSNVGTPSVNVTLGGTANQRTIDLAFHNLKGEQGDTPDMSNYVTVNGYQYINSGKTFGGSVAVDGSGNTLGVSHSQAQSSITLRPGYSTNNIESDNAPLFLKCSQGVQINGGLDLNSVPVLHLKDTYRAILAGTSNDNLYIKSENGDIVFTYGNTSVNVSDLAANTLPSQTGQSGKFLTTNGTTASWASVDALPSQSGNNGKFLTTDGTDASWASITMPTVDQTYNSSSANAQSGVAIAGALTNYVDNSTNQTIAGTKTFSGTIIPLYCQVTGQLTFPNAGYIQSGGTNNLRIRSTGSSSGSVTLWGPHIYVTDDGVNQKDLLNAQLTTNLVTSVDSSSTDSQYPSAKLFYDTVGDIETLINAL